MARKASKARIALKGSEKKPLKGAQIVGAARRDERIEVTVLVRRRQGIPDRVLAAATRADVRARKHLSREELREKFGADPADLAEVEAFAENHGLDVVRASRAERMVRLSGSVQAMQEAFGVRLRTYRAGKQVYRGRTGAIRVPAVLAEIVTGVFGLDNRRQARAHFHLREQRGRFGARAGSVRAFTPVEVGRLYQFPPNLDGSGECIAILELGGGYRKKDLVTYFGSLGIPVPSVTAVSVQGGHNSPTGKPSGPDGEVMLDIEVAGAVAPGAKIAVYFAPNTDDGFIGALSAAIHDTLRQPSVVSISWGNPERLWTSQAVKAFDTVCQDAAALGVTIFCSAGDHGSDDEDPPTGRANADFPASSPHVLGCGGTHLEAQGGSIAVERVWNTLDGWATGGGVSEVFKLPLWQKGAGVPKAKNTGGKVGRGVPDVAGDADSDTGYKVRVDGVNSVFGGTSAVSPLWAGLMARINQSRRKPVGFLNPLIYGLSASSGAFRDITQGDNGAYAAKKGWDACTGLGSPNGKKLLKALK